ncbi:hypothetical protein JXA32_03805 [Candidatus Sumerlaeota bacterium]|nr:hypothetical protein [Candidatus Sumerlaeota bacterium]
MKMSLPLLATVGLFIDYTASESLNDKGLLFHIIEYKRLLQARQHGSLIASWPQVSRRSMHWGALNFLSPIRLLTTLIATFSMLITRIMLMPQIDEAGMDLFFLDTGILPPGANTAWEIKSSRSFVVLISTGKRLWVRQSLHPAVRAVPGMVSWMETVPPERAYNGSYVSIPSYISTTGAATIVWFIWSMLTSVGPELFVQHLENSE